MKLLLLFNAGRTFFSDVLLLENKIISIFIK